MDGLCQSYHWEFAAAKKLTLPQIVMLNHAADVNHKRAEERIKAKEQAKKQGVENPVVFGGKRVDELGTEDFIRYWGVSAQEPHEAEPLS